MTRDEAITAFERQLKSAAVVLDGGFGTHPGESDTLYRKRKEMAEMALAALRGQAEDNEPLTLDELREMDGEPVYVEMLFGYKPYYNGWVLVSLPQKHEDTVLLQYASGRLDFADTLIERGAKLYRHKPKEVAQ